MLIKKQSKGSVLPRRTLPLLSNELAERLSFYGLAAILPIFLKNQFYEGSETEAASVLHLWKSGVYLFPLLGAIIADVFLGKYRTILVGSVICCIGHVVLSLSIDNPPLFLAGLFIIALSAGIIKSNVSPFLGNQVDESAHSQRSLLFNYFYLCINVGAAVAQLCLPYLRENYGNALAFLVPGLAMFAALIVFWIPNKSYKKDENTSLAEFKKHFSENLDGIRRACTLFSFVIIYFMLYENGSGAWVYQAEKLNLHIWRFKLAADQLQSSNPILILILIPVFTLAVFPYLKRKHGIALSIFQKMKIGFVLLIISFLIIIGIQAQIGSGLHPHLSWQLFAYLFLTASEVLVSVSCLEYAYQATGPNVKSIATSLFLLAISLGNLLLSWLTSEIHAGSLTFIGIGELNTRYYLLLLVLMLINTIVFFLAFSGKSHVRKDFEDKQDVPLRPISLE